MIGGEKRCVVDILIMLALSAWEHTDRGVSVSRGALSALQKRRKGYKGIKTN
jgi:hypothetical protein